MQATGPYADLAELVDQPVHTQLGAGEHDRASFAVRDGRITILVSHRFSTVRIADLIVVVDGARIVEAGTHEALIERRGQYAQLYGMQAAAYR